MIKVQVCVCVSEHSISRSDLIKEKYIQTLKLFVFCMLLLCCLSRSSLSVSQQRSGSCYSHSSSVLTATARHVSILRWRRTRRRVNTTVLRERWRTGGGRTRRRRDRRIMEFVRKTIDRKKGEGCECECEQNLRQKAQREREAINKFKHEKGGMELVLTQNYPVG